MKCRKHAIDMQSSWYKPVSGHIVRRLSGLLEVYITSGLLKICHDDVWPTLKSVFLRIEHRLNQSKPLIEDQETDSTMHIPQIKPPSDQKAKRQQQRLIGIDMDQIQKDVQETIDENKYYNKDTPRVGGPAKPRLLWMTALMIGATVVVGIALLYCCYETCVPLLQGLCRHRQPNVDTDSYESIRMSHQSSRRQR
jgi:hypothetical protein